jgi:hypothetical protein
MSKRLKFQNKDLYLTISLGSFFTILPFLNEARKEYNKLPIDFMWSLTFILILLVIGILSLGIYIGLNIAERKLKR